ncbi:ankyrin repeat-containing domain protein, partial [Russula aff. rugulosa BPL654]
MELLLKKGANVDVKGTLDNTLLHCASRDGRPDVVKLLLKHDAVVNAKDKYGWTPLHGAASKGGVEVAKHLFNVKKDGNGERLNVNVQSNNMNTPLHVASIAGNLEMVKLLLSHGAKMGIEGEKGWTPLEAA